MNRKKILYVQITKIPTSPAIRWYTTLWKSKIQKCEMMHETNPSLLNFTLQMSHIIKLLHEILSLSLTWARQLSIADSTVLRSVTTGRHDAGVRLPRLSADTDTVTMYRQRQCLSKSCRLSRCLDVDRFGLHRRRWLCRRCQRRWNVNFNISSVNPETERT